MFDSRALMGILGDSLLSDSQPSLVTPGMIKDLQTTVTASEADSYIHLSSILAGALSVLPSAATAPTPITSRSQAPTTFIVPTSPIMTSPSSASLAPKTVSVANGYAAASPITPPSEITEWKVIGIAVISVTLIASIILAVTFFDSWWGFLRAAILGQRRHGGNEDLVPDWEKRSWELRVANEDGHRYPTLASLESIRNAHQERKSLGNENVYEARSKPSLCDVLVPPKVSHS
ncbi:hypothetical protein B0H34DRAFT_792859 [Crassisporium funariophilum]|nr:hypothetical protein B0H34DRAFT_792859 [Crassisporium funariophilum]